MKLFGLYDYQADAVAKMKNGCILCGGVGSGKSRTSIAYFLTQQEGVRYDADGITPSKRPIQDLYIITTARKRDDKEWEGDMAPFLLYPDHNAHKNKIVIDSWNNISKYIKVHDSFFIFDEQRLCGSGKWVKSFYKIAKANNWILLSATPGDKWKDYIPVFVANGFYRNKTEFESEHIVYDYRAGYPQLVRYLGEKRLEQLKSFILVDMDFKRSTERIYVDVPCLYNRERYLNVVKKRVDPYTGEPIETASKYCQILREIVNSDDSRKQHILKITKEHPKSIIFYSFDYELDILKNLAYERGTVVAEWNGHNHEQIPESDRWVYLVQYTAGAEGWNCTLTDTIIFYSQQYSYKTFEQACGRIDRVTTPYKQLYYYILKSLAPIDKAISRSLSAKRDFSVRGFSKTIFKERIA